MIFERRAYTLRPGKLEAFWDAQRTWNTKAVFGPILNRNIAYLSTVTGHSDQVVHLYRFDSLDQWHTLYGQYYEAQSPEYFALVRPWMLRQENAFLVPPPVKELASCWTGSGLLLPSALQPIPAPEAICVTETTIDFFPGGMPAYWKAHQAHGFEAGADDRRHLMAVMMSLVGRLHRLVRYQGFANATEAQQYYDARAADPRWKAFVRAYADWVASETTMALRPSPVPSRRALFEGRSATDGPGEIDRRSSG